MDEYGGLSNYVKRPKREKEQILNIAGPARSNFSSHKGGFRGQMSHTLFTSAQNISGVQNRGRAGKFCDYVSRENEALATYGNKTESKTHFSLIESEILPARSNSVIQRRLVVQLPREFLNNANKNLARLCKDLDAKYFSRSGAFVVALHGGGKDFKNPHLHIIFSNRDANLKNIREYHSKDFLSGVKRDIAQFITTEIGIKCEVSAERKPENRHYPRWVSEAFKRATADKSGETLKKYIAKYPIFQEYAETQRNKIIDKKIINKEQKLKNVITAEIAALDKLSEKIVKQKTGKEFTGFAEKTKHIFAKITGREEAEKVKHLKEGKEMCDWLNPKPENQEIKKIQAKKEKIKEIEKINSKINKKINSRLFSIKEKNQLIQDREYNISLKYRLETEIRALQAPALPEKKEQESKKDISNESNKTKPELIIPNGYEVSNTNKSPISDKKIDAFAEDLKRRQVEKKENKIKR